MRGETWFVLDPVGAPPEPVVGGVAKPNTSSPAENLVTAAPTGVDSPGDGVSPSAVKTFPWAPKPGNAPLA